MEEKKKAQVQENLCADSAQEVKLPKEEKEYEVSATWAEETISDLDDFIESQGIYIRQ